jgi:hypothetical protein
MRSLFPPWWFEHPYACPRMARNSERLERPTRVVLKKGGLDIELARCQGPYSCDKTMRNFVCTLELRLLCKMMNNSFHAYRVNDFHGSMHQTLLLLTLLIKNINMSLLVAACAGRRCRQAIGYGMRCRQAMLAGRAPLPEYYVDRRLQLAPRRCFV